MLFYVKKSIINIYRALHEVSAAKNDDEQHCNYRQPTLGKNTYFKKKNQVDSGSQGAFIIFLVDGKQNCNLISWQSKRIRQVTKSSLVAETLSLSEGLDNAYYVASLYNEILYNGNENLFPNEAYIDNKSLFNSLQSTKMVSERRLRLDISAIKEMLSSNEIVKIDWLPTEKQLSNSLTKQGANTRDLISCMRNGYFVFMLFCFFKFHFCPRIMG